MGYVRATRRMARDVLLRYWDGKLPVNAVQIAYKLDFTVRYDTKLQHAHRSGELAAENREIVINPLETTMRQRFTVLHELGHYLMEHKSAVRLDSDAYESPEGSGTSDEELLANVFAAEISMPESCVRAFCGRGLSIRDMADKFDVSDRIMGLRLGDLGIV